MTLRQSTHRKTSNNNHHQASLPKLQGGRDPDADKAACTWVLSKTKKGSMVFTMAVPDEMKKCEVTCVEKGQDVERVTWRLACGALLPR